MALSIVVNFNRLSRAHERYRRQTTVRRQTTYGRTIAYSERANVNVTPRSLKTYIFFWLRRYKPMTNTCIVDHCHSSEHQIVEVTTLAFSRWRTNSEVVISHRSEHSAERHKRFSVILHAVSQGSLKTSYASVMKNCIFSVRYHTAIA